MLYYGCNEINRLEYKSLQINMQEEKLYQWWQYYARVGGEVQDGRHHLKIIDPGQFNTTCGPDFLSARFELDGVVFQGDVECHRHPRDWYQHQHHLDRAYRSVVLHVVMMHERSLPTRNQWLSAPIPVFCLPRPDNSVQTLYPARTCLPGNHYLRHLRAALRSMAIERFRLKVKQFQEALQHENEHELFYQYFLRALGYPANGEAFQLLAHRLPFSWLMENRRRIGAVPQVLLALYAGQAGFLPQHPPDDYTRQLLTIYNQQRFRLSGQEIDALQWRFAGVRPYNHPHSRLAAWVHLLTYREGNILDDLLQLLSKRDQVSTTFKDINQYFAVPVDDYWQRHYAFGKRLTVQIRRYFWSQARISELLLNVILPLLAVRAVEQGSEGFYDYLQYFFEDLPYTCSYSSLHKEMPWAGACLQQFPRQSVYQALIHVHSHYCRQGACRACPLHRRQPGKD